MILCLSEEGELPLASEQPLGLALPFHDWPARFGWVLNRVVRSKPGLLDFVRLPLIAWHEVTQSIFHPTPVKAMAV